MKETRRYNFYKFFELLIELVGWLQIMISPTLIGGIIGLAVYYRYENLIGTMIGLGTGLLGLFFGIVWASKIFKSEKGTFWFISRIMATPDLDKNEETERGKSA